MGIEGAKVIATDIEGLILRMNPVAETLTGWSYKEALGRDLREVFNIVNARTGQVALNPVIKVLKKGKIVGIANHTMLISREGTKYQIADSAAPIRDAEGKPKAYTAVTRDVTERHRAEKRLAK